MIGIYKITNKINKNFYIGSSKNIEERWKKHLRIYKNPNMKEYEYPLYRSFRKYGEENFELEVLEEFEKYDQETLIEREVYYYELLKPDYNQMRPALTPIYNPTEEERKERSIKYTGEGNPFYGKTHTEETKKILSDFAKKRKGELNPFYGKTHTEETKRTIALKNGKEVIAIDQNGKEYYFQTAVDAGEWCRELGLTKSKTPNSDILKACKSGKKAFTFYWQYK